MFVPRCQLSPALCWGQTPFSPSAGHGPAPGNPDVVLAMAPALSPFLGGPHEAPAPTSSPWGALWVSALLLLVQERMEPAPAAWHGKHQKAPRTTHQPRASKQVGGSYLKKTRYKCFWKEQPQLEMLQGKEKPSPAPAVQLPQGDVAPRPSLCFPHPPCTRLPLAIPCHSGTGLGEVCWDFVMVCIIQRPPNGPCHLAVTEKRFPGERSEVCT